MTLQAAKSCGGGVGVAGAQVVRGALSAVAAPKSRGWRGRRWRRQCRAGDGKSRPSRKKNQEKIISRVVCCARAQGEKEKTEEKKENKHESVGSVWSRVRLVGVFRAFCSLRRARRRAGFRCRAAGFVDGGLVVLAPIEEFA